MDTSIPIQPVLRSIPEDLEYDPASNGIEPGDPPAQENHTGGLSQSGHRRRVPRQFCDYHPTRDMSTFLPTPPNVQAEQSSCSSSRPDPALYSPSEPTRIYLTKPDKFGLVRAYTRQVSSDPDENHDIEALLESDGVQERPPSDNPNDLLGDLFRIDPNLVELYDSWTVAALVTWHLKVSQGHLTPQKLDQLVHQIILHENFSAEDLEKFKTSQALKILDSLTPESVSDTWRTSTFEIPLPYDKTPRPEALAPTYPVEVRHRSLVNVIKSTVQSPDAKNFHWIPHKLYHLPPNSDIDLQAVMAASVGVPLSKFDLPGAERVHGEFYTSDIWIEEQEKLEAKFTSPGETNSIPVAIVNVNLSSDTLQAANFGTASVCPMYCSFGNHSKYRRSRPSVRMHQQVAYMPKLGDNLQDVYLTHGDKAATRALLGHLRRECHNGTVDIMIDEDFLHAYEHGIVIECADGIVRRIFPRFFVYSADYPEKCGFAFSYSLLST